jgi:HEAT repeat protein
MELYQIKIQIDSPDPQERLRAITALRQHSRPAVVIPLLKRRLNDQEFIIRASVATGLGHQQTEAAFELLIELVENDLDPNVRAEAANSLAKYEERAFPHLLRLFERDAHWLVRQSIFAGLLERDCPEILLQLCRWGIAGDDLVVQETAVANLGRLAPTPQAEAALSILLSLVTAEAVPVRAQVARVLGEFKQPEAEAALAQLRQDEDYQVVGATFERLLSD